MHLNRTKNWRWVRDGKTHGDGIPKWTLKEFADHIGKHVNHLGQLCRYYPLPSHKGTALGPNHAYRYNLPDLKAWWNNIPEEKRNPK